MAELGLDVVCSIVPEMLLAEGVRVFAQHFERSSGAGHHHKLNLARMQGDVLADLSQADLEEHTCRQASASKRPSGAWMSCGIR